MRDNLKFFKLLIVMILSFFCTMDFTMAQGIYDDSSYSSGMGSYDSSMGGYDPSMGGSGMGMGDPSMSSSGMGMGDPSMGGSGMGGLDAYGNPTQPGGFPGAGAPPPSSYSSLPPAAQVSPSTTSGGDVASSLFGTIGSVMNTKTTADAGVATTALTTGATTAQAASAEKFALDGQKMNMQQNLASQQMANHSLLSVPM